MSIQLSVLSEPYWSEFEQRFGVDPWLRRIGYLFLAADEAQLHVLREQVELQHRFGVPSEILVSEDLASRWPILAELGFAGGSYCRTDGYLNQHRAVHERWPGRPSVRRKRHWVLASVARGNSSALAGIGRRQSLVAQTEGLDRKRRRS